MRLFTLALLIVAISSAHGEDLNANRKNVALWYDAFDQQNPALIDRILGEHWEDIPAAPGQLPGREGAKKIIAELWAAFPDFSIKIKDIIQEGNKVVVRSEISGTQKNAFMGFPAKGRRLTSLRNYEE